MHKLLAKSRCYVSAAALLVIGGCVSGPQFFDFGRTEVARITADVVGRLVALFQTAT